MSQPPGYRPAIAVAALLSLAVFAISACGGTSSAKSPSKPATAATAAKTATASAPATGAVTATLTEFKIVATPQTVKAGRVVFHVTNKGNVKHQFTVIRTTKSAAKVLSNAKPNDDIPGARGEIAAIEPGKSKTLVVKHLKAGHYAIVCALPGHYQSGMFTDFTVA